MGFHPDTRSVSWVEGDRTDFGICGRPFGLHSAWIEMMESWPTGFFLLQVASPVSRRRRRNSECEMTSFWAEVVFDLATEVLTSCNQALIHGIFFNFTPELIAIGLLDFNVIYKIVVSFHFNQFSS